MKKLLFVILIPFLGIAQTFTANRIKYTVTSSTAPFTVKVARNANFTGAAEIPEIVTYNSKNYIVTAIGEDAFEHCNTLTSVTIPNSVTDIENGAFFSCSGLTSITIPNSVTAIENFAFFGCFGLTSVTIPNSVTAIENFAFFGCFGLTSVTIPNSVTAIEERAFADCSSLRTVNCHITSPLVINANVFGNVTQSNCALNVPTGTQAVYQAAAVWRNFSPISGSLLSNHSFAIESALKIYPNPVSEILNIALQEGLQLQKVNFYNTLGQLIKTTNHSEINVSSFAKGNYFVEVITNQGKATKTIIIQ
ncbi:leucine-rich repeat protein [Flavobacterium psychrophilum]|uniref:leucine-rich repeat domain-containing protein n=2 Tax=Flavobacterium psychrophilum TaxID=96345 RepID=UPI001069900C|nr:leucine-rich repeat domain-containing protein [Flavobacterium psychrophilum]QLI58340.1 leucine-rich repeat domain-containing protein [Flavobacterium psychrophilum]UOV37645.1 leucine-rich repeat protein [Flavobacterium psychrophilum]UOV40068.1 leucine-rich repeat protein [Flavobacterium psychrophilum]UOV42520.1 leucine-rich repeat protein [Flavobacterium psychrophilum]UOV44975.1 leucine-rich repeat protein [Flavobacterium psychrophilum]